MRYAYGLTAALLIAGAGATVISGHPAGAQVAQNEPSAMRASAPRGAPMSFADLTAQLAPAVVNISTKQKVTIAGNPMNDFFGQFFGQQFQNSQPRTTEAQSLGSGFLISSDGYVVTNNHVVAPGNKNATVESITVTLPDRSEYTAKLVARDVASDIAVLKISRAQPFPFVKFGDSKDARVGDWVIAIGNPFGLGGTVTAGIISAKTRSVNGGSAYDRYIQTDAAINQGNSGGPMFDLNGNVIGINNAIISPNGGSVGIGFAIPADIAKPVVEKLIHGEKIVRGYLGVEIQQINDDLAASLGIGKGVGEFIQRVEPGQAAEKAGMQPGDVVLSVGGRQITPDNTLSYVVANMAPGTRVPIEVIRNGRHMTLQAVVGTRPSEEALAKNFGNDNSGDDGTDGGSSQGATQNAAANKIGLATLQLNPTIRRQLNIADNVQGVVVNAVDPDSDAAEKQIQRGDIILSVDGEPATTPAQFAAEITRAERAGRTAVLLRVQRSGQPAVFVPVRLKGH